MRLPWLLIIPLGVILLSFIVSILLLSNLVISKTSDKVSADKDTIGDYIFIENILMLDPVNTGDYVFKGENDTPLDPVLKEGRSDFYCNLAKNFPENYNPEIYCTE